MRKQTPKIPVNNTFDSLVNIVGRDYVCYNFLFLVMAQDEQGRLLPWTTSCSSLMTTVSMLTSTCLTLSSNSETAEATWSRMRFLAIYMHIGSAFYSL